MWRAAGLTSLAWDGISVAAQGSQAALIVNPSNAPMVALQTRTVPDSTLCAILRWTTIASIVTTTIVQQAALMMQTVHSSTLFAEVVVFTLVDVQQQQIARAMMRCAMWSTQTATGAMVPTAEQVASLMPTALWNDRYVVPLPLTEVVLILLEVALTFLEVVPT